MLAEKLGDGYTVSFLGINNVRTVLGLTVSQQLWTSEIFPLGEMLGTYVFPGKGSEAPSALRMVVGVFFQGFPGGHSYPARLQENTVYVHSARMGTRGPWGTTRKAEA